MISLSTTVAALAVSLPLSSPQGPGGNLASPLEEQLPQLQEQSSWAQDTRYEGISPDKTRRGVYPVGNGRVFAYLGLGARANTMQGLTGPNYQTSEERANNGHFGELSFDVLIDGEVVDLRDQRVRRVRGANFVLTEDAAPRGLALRTLTFAPPEQAILVRVLEVINLGRDAATDLHLRMTADGSVESGSGLREDYSVDGRACTAFYTLDGSSVTDSSLVLPLDELQPGESQRAVFTLSTVSGTLESGAAPTPTTLDDAVRLARTTWEWWQAKLAATTRMETDHVKLRDLFEDWKVLMLVQRCSQSGVITPMVNTRAARVRDSNGAMLALLRYRLWDEARTILQFTYEAVRATGQVTGSVPLDLELDTQRKVDWNQISVVGNEVPSWIILQHFWYWRATRDTELIRQHWPLLDVCMKRQRRGPRGEMLFDENGGVLRRTLSRPGQPSYSFANGVLFLVAVQAMAEMTSGIDREVNPERFSGESAPEPRGAALLRRSSDLMQDLEQLYWLEDDEFFAPALEPVDLTPLRTPFANSALLPLWVGWTFPTGQKSTANLQQTLKQLWRNGARIGTTPTVGYASGELQGLLLAALAERNGQKRLDALDSLLEMAEPAGEWGEMYDPDGRPVATDHPEWPNRLRPGESGINLDAIAFAVTGVRYASYASWDIDDIRLDLRLPNGATHLAMRNVEKDGRRLDLYMREVYEVLSPERWEANANRLPENQRDPREPQRHLNFTADLLSPNPPRGYYDITIDAGGTVFMRYLRREEPVAETELWIEDPTRFFPADERSGRK